MKSASQEALRAESTKETRALLDLGAIHPTLEKRKVDDARLAKLLALVDSHVSRYREP